jgi:hypothetical protein
VHENALPFVFNALPFGNPKLLISNLKQLFLSFQWLLYGDHGCSTATSPGVTCHSEAGAEGTVFV